MPDMLEIDKSSPEARAKRLREVRQLAGLTLKKMTEDGFINYNTLSGWETGKHGGLSERGAARVVQRLEKEGCKCSIVWLLYGKGEEPYLDKNENVIRPKTLNSSKAFTRECGELLQKAYPELVGMLIEDEAMDPDYSAGDFILAIPHSHVSCSVLHKCTAMVKVSGQLMVRQIICNKSESSFHLQCTNPNYQPSLLKDVEIQESYRIICHIKKPNISQ